MIIPALTVVLGLAILAACDAPPAVQTTVAQTAEQVVTELAKHVPTAKPSVVFTAETDQNKLRGRPHGYQTKASFTDLRIHPRDAFDTSQGSVDLGGSVEVFADEQAAHARMRHIQTLARVPIITEYDYISGRVLVRVSKALTPDQAAEYQKALAQINT